MKKLENLLNVFNKSSQKFRYRTSDDYPLTAIKDHPIDSLSGQWFGLRIPEIQAETCNNILLISELHKMGKILETCTCDKDPFQNISVKLVQF